MKLRPVFGGAVAVGVGLAVILLFNSSNTKKSGSPVNIGIKKAEAAACDDEDAYKCLPELDFVDIDGRVFTSKDLKGKVVMVNFWATWCGPCKSEVPHLSAAYEKYKEQGFLVLGVMVDQNDDNDALEKFASAHKLTYPVVRVDYAISRAWGSPRNLPTTVLYDRAGKMRWDKVGVIRPNELERAVPELLAEPAPAL